MDSDNKRANVDAGGATDTSTTDSTNRARNRTIMLTPEMTGQVRARLVAPGGDEVSPMISSSEDEASEQIQPVFRPGSWQPAPPPTPQITTTEDDNDWTRPISTGEEIAAPAAVQPTGGGPGGNPLTTRNGAGHTALPAPAPSFASASSGGSGNQGSHSAASEYVVWRTMSPITGFLVSFDNEEMGAYIELRQGRLIVTSEEESTGNYICIRDRTVSPMHAIMRVQSGGEVQVLDQLSESGTRIIRAGSNEEELLSGEKGVIRNGDIVSFGDRKYHVCLLISA